MAATSSILSDWQLKCKEIKQRGSYLLQSGQWSDCTFMVGSEPHQVIGGHKLILAIASPVFEAMFFGGMPERNNPITIMDVQPEAFKALMEYIYTDNINISSVEKACELFYGAKKYMLPHLEKKCTEYIWSHLDPKNACRVYEYARLFEENDLMEKCLQIISTNTKEVLNDSSFEDVDINSVITVFSMDDLNVDSELDLFNAAVRYAKAQEKQSSDSSVAPQVESKRKSKTKSRRNSKEKVLPDDSSPKSIERVEETVSSSQPLCEHRITKTETKDKPTIRSAIEKIRFLTLTPQQFADGPARSSLLTNSEIFAVIMNIASSASDVALPAGFSTCRALRNRNIKTEDDESRPQGTFRLVIENFKGLTDAAISAPYYVRNLPWTILVMPRKRRKQKTMGFYLKCNMDSESNSWSCIATAELRLICHKPDTKPYSKKIEHMFCSKEIDWGFADFMLYTDILDPDNGYIKDDAITVEVHVAAELPVL